MRKYFLPARSQSGVIIVAILWGVTLLALLAASFTSSARTQAYMSRNFVNLAQARALADAGVYHVIHQLTRIDSTEIWTTNGAVYNFQWQDENLFLSLQDERGKLDLNRSAESSLSNLFQIVGVGELESDELAAAILDWRDSNSRRRLNGAEVRDYELAGLDTVPKNDSFDVIDELQTVMGMTPEIFESVKPFITVYSRSRQIEQLSASPEVLQARYGIDSAGIELMLTRQTQNSALPSQLARRFQAAQTARGRPASDTYLISVLAELESGSRFVREAIVQISSAPDQPFIIHRWIQGSVDIFDAGMDLSVDGESMAEMP